MTKGLKSRCVCFNALEKTILGGASLIIHGEKLTSEDRAFAKLLAHTTLKHFGTHDVIIQKLAGKKRKIDDKIHILLNMALTQMRVLDVPDYAAINTSLLIAEKEKQSHAKGFLNGVLRNYTRQKDQFETIDAKHTVPPWMFKAWKKHYGPEVAEKIAKSILAEPSLDCITKENAEIWAKKLNGKAIGKHIVRRSFGGKITDLTGYDDGAWWIQDIAATAPVIIANPQKGEHILDLCAAPGGKTAQLCQSGAHVTAADVAEDRLYVLRQNMKRLGFNPKIVRADGSTFSSDTLFDTILIDAPCSGTGVLRRHPDILFTRCMDDIQKLQETQLALLNNAMKLLKVGGKIIYSTCSLQKEEGEDVIWAFLRTQKTMEQIPIIPQNTGLPQTLMTKQGALRTLPFFMHDEGGMDGFFIAHLKKTA